MKLIRGQSDRIVFEFGAREKRLLMELLNLYPCIPPAHQRISKSGRLPDQAASQHLLDEALAEQRAENKKQIQRLVSDPARFAPHGSAFRLSLSTGETEWLLQVLNDIRVGSWILLGSPEERIGTLNAETAQHLWAMEMAGAIQMAMLQALEGGT